MMSIAHPVFLDRFQCRSVGANIENKNKRQSKQPLLGNRGNQPGNEPGNRATVAKQRPPRCAYFVVHPRWKQIGTPSVNAVGEKSGSPPREPLLAPRPGQHVAGHLPEDRSSSFREGIPHTTRNPVDAVRCISFGSGGAAYHYARSRNGRRITLCCWGR